MPVPTPRAFDPRFRRSAPALPTPITSATPSAPAPTASGQAPHAGQTGMAQRWEHLLRRAGLSSEARAVGMVLTGYADRHGDLSTATPGLGRLSGRVPIHKLTIRGALRELEQEGWIRRDPHLSGPQGSQVHAITLTIPAHLQGSKP